MEITLDKLIEYKQALDEISNEEIRKEIFSIIEPMYKPRVITKVKNNYPICQLDENTFEVLNKYNNIREANLAIGKLERSTGIADATRGRTGTYYAYGYLWVRENELDKAIERIKSRRLENDGN